MRSTGENIVCFDALHQNAAARNRHSLWTNNIRYDRTDTCTDTAMALLDSRYTLKLVLEQKHVPSKHVTTNFVAKQPLGN